MKKVHGQISNALEALKAGDTGSCRTALECAKNLVEKKLSPESAKALSEFDKSIRCLALELPGSVWDDVNDRWQRVKGLIN